MEQYEGHWTFEGGKVLPFRWLPDPRGIPSNVIEVLPQWVSAATWGVALDYGYSDPAVALFVAVSPTGEMVIASEIYERHLTDYDLVERVLAREKLMGIHVSFWVPDPQRPVLTEILRRKGLPLYNRDAASVVRDRAAGYQALRDALSVDPAIGRPRLSVLRACEHTIAEWKLIRFKDKYSDEFSDGSISGEDHSADAMRYFLMSRPKARPRETAWITEWEAQARLIKKYAAKSKREDRVLIGSNPDAFARAY
jgi:hypothetical protein